LTTRTVTIPKIPCCAAGADWVFASAHAVSTAAAGTAIAGERGPLQKVAYWSGDDEEFGKAKRRNAGGAYVCAPCKCP